MTCLFYVGNSQSPSKGLTVTDDYDRATDDRNKNMFGMMQDTKPNVIIESSMTAEQNSLNSQPSPLRRVGSNNSVSSTSLQRISPQRSLSNNSIHSSDDLYMSQPPPTNDTIMINNKVNYSPANTTKKLVESSVNIHESGTFDYVDTTIFYIQLTNCDMECQ